MKTGNLFGRAAAIACLALLACGCGQTTVRFNPGPRINTHGLPPTEPSGRLLEVAVISLGSHHYPRINQTTQFRNAIYIDDPSPLGVITAEHWFRKDGEAVLRPVIPEQNAIATTLVKANEPQEVRVRSFRSWNPLAKGSGILVLANFHGLGTEPSIQSDVWIPKSSLFGGSIVVNVGEKAISRAP